MIPTLNQVVAAVLGAWKLLVWDDDGLARFDMTLAGFWRSFFGPLAALPLVILIQIARLAAIDETIKLNPDVELPPLPPTNIFLGLETVAYISEVALFPLIMIPLARQLGLTANYVPFIITWNWVNALVIGLLTVPHLLYVAGALGLASLYGFSLVIFGFGLCGLYFATRKALATSPFLATLIVVLGIITGLLLGDLLTFVFT